MQFRNFRCVYRRRAIALKVRCGEGLAESPDCIVENLKSGRCQGRMKRNPPTILGKNYLRLFIRDEATDPQSFCALKNEREFSK
jgi:hypothetical protein